MWTRASLRNERHVFVRESSIPGAGSGLFLRVRAPSRHPGQARHEVFIQPNTHLCVYSNEMITSDEYDRLANVDYVFVRESSISGAGNGLFLHARAPSRHPGQAWHEVFIQANTHLYVYSNEMITSDEYDRLANVDYVMQNRRGIFNPETFSSPTA